MNNNNNIETRRSGQGMSNSPENQTNLVRLSFGRIFSLTKDFGSRIYDIFETVIGDFAKLLRSLIYFCFQATASRGDENQTQATFSIWERVFGPPYPRPAYLNFVLHNYCGANLVKAEENQKTDQKLSPGIPNATGTDCFMNAVFQCISSVHQCRVDSPLFYRNITIPQEKLNKTINKDISILESYALQLKSLQEKLQAPNQETEIRKDYEELKNQTRKYFYRGENRIRKDLLTQMRELLNEIFFSLSDKVDPSFSLTHANQELRTILPKINTDIKSYTQCDAQEYLLVVLESLQCKKYKYCIQHQLKINNQTATYNDTEANSKFSYLTARFPQKKPETPLNLTKMVLLSYPEERQKFILPNSKTEVPEGTYDNQKLMLRGEIPPFIPIHLTRFSSEGYKIFNEVDFDPVIEVEIEGTPDKAIYKFNSVVLHYGSSSENGHYVAYSQKTSGNQIVQEEYILYNDQKVSICKGIENVSIIKEDIRKNGYLFFYVLDNIDKEN